jgi:hypothetical protein
LADLLDTTISLPALNQVLTYNGASWINQALPTPSLVGLTDTTITAPLLNDYLRFDGASWVNSQLPTTALNDISDVNITAPVQEHLLYYDAGTTSWVNGRLPLGDFSFATNQLSNLAVPYLQFDPANVSVLASDLTLGANRSLNINGVSMVNGGQNFNVSGARDWLFDTTNNRGTYAFKLGSNAASNFAVTDVNDTVLFSVDSTGALTGNFPAPSTALNDITDVSLTAPVLDNYLRFDGVNWVNTAFPAIPSLLNDITDVSLTAPTLNQVLTYDGANWINQALPAQTIPSLDDLTNTTITAPVLNDYLRFDGASWVNGQLPTTALNDITDVSLTAPTLNQVLTYNGSSWVNQVLPAQQPVALNDVTDVSLTAPVLDNYLRYDGANWVNTAFPAIPSLLNDITDVSLTAPALNQVLTYNGANWINQALPAQSLVGLTDTTITAPVLDNYLRYDGANWVNTAFPAIPSLLNDITDVSLTAPALDNYLRYDGANWVNTAFPSIPSNINDLGDATITAPTDGQYLKYDNATSQWINDTLPAGANLANFTFTTDNINVDGVSCLKLTSVDKRMTTFGNFWYEGLNDWQFQQTNNLKGFSFRFNDSDFTSKFMISDGSSQSRFEVHGDGSIVCDQLLTNVQTSGITAGDFITYNGSNWVNSKTINLVNYDPTQPFEVLSSTGLCYLQLD